jgi:ABC-2 type transport system permease protein
MIVPGALVIAGDIDAPAVAVVDLVEHPNGTLVHLDVLPGAIKSVAPYVPAYHLGQLALSALGADRGAPVWSHVAALAGFTCLFLALALWGYRNDEGKTYG